MSWEAFVLTHAAIGLLLAAATARFPAKWALPAGTGLLWLLPCGLYGGLAAQSGGSLDEFAAWSLLFIVPAASAGCLVLYAVRLGMRLCRRRKSGRAAKRG